MQAAADKSSARSERLGLFADQSVEIESPFVARRRGPRGAYRCQQQHEDRRGDAKEHPDRVTDAVEVAERDALGVGCEHLPIRQVVAVREKLDEANLVMTQRDHTCAYLAVIAGPQEIGPDAAAEEDDDQIEAGIVVTRGPSSSRIGQGSHGQPVSVRARSPADDALPAPSACGLALER